jgi:hypothetical protein
MKRLAFIIFVVAVLALVVFNVRMKLDKPIPGGFQGTPRIVPLENAKPTFVEKKKQ